MPKVDVPSGTYEAIERIAARSGTDIAATVAEALSQFIHLKEMSDGEYQREWDVVLATIAASRPSAVTAAEVESDIDAATDEVWAKRRAGSR